MPVRTLMGSLVLVACTGSVASADAYLSGGLIYWSDALGNNVAGAYEYDTFTTTVNSKMTLNGDSSDPVIALLPGMNIINFSSPHASTLSVGLFLSDSAVATPGPFGLSPDLVVTGVPGAITAVIPGSGVEVSTFGQFSPSMPFHGRNWADIGDLRVSIVGFTYATSGRDGLITLFVGPVPAPASMAVLGMLTLCTGRRRR